MSENTERNRLHFNKQASSYGTKYSSTIEQLIAEIQARRDWIGARSAEDDLDEQFSASSPKRPSKVIRLLDYACGTGLVSRALAPYVTQSVGIDVSEGMVSEYNKTAFNQGIPTSEMKAHVGNLLSPTDVSPSTFSSEEFFNFDIAAVGMGFHHFDDPELAVKRLAERLNVGGVLFLVDFLPHDDHVHKGHAAEHTVKHLGFAEEDIKAMFDRAGMGRGFEYVILGSGVVFVRDGTEIKREVFMARGSKG